MDWVAVAAAGSFAQALAGFAGAGAVLYAAHKGASTVQSWLGQKSAERQIEAAERILTLAHRLALEFKAIRSPAVTVGETEAADRLLQEGDPRFAGLGEAAKKQMVNSQVYVTRLADRRPLWDELFACVPLAKAYFGEDVEAAVLAFWAQRAAVYGAAMVLAEGELDREARNRFEGEIWEGWNAARNVADPISDAIKAALGTLEARLLPILRASTGPTPK